MYSSICLIDDEQDFLEPLQEILEDAKYQVVSFKHPTAALEYLRNNKVDIVITDYCLPAMTGTEFLLKLQITARHIPIAFCVTGSDLMNQADAFHYGAEAVFAKPFSSKTLLHTLGLINLSKSMELNKSFTRTMNEAAWVLIKIEDFEVFQCKLLSFNDDGFFGYCINKIPKLNVKAKIILQIYEQSLVQTIELEGDIKWVTMNTIDSRYACGVGVKLHNITQAQLDALQSLLPQPAIK